MGSGRSAHKKIDYSVSGSGHTGRDKVIREGKINEDRECIFPAPKVHYTVIMDAGAGHVTDPWDPRDDE